MVHIIKKDWADKGFNRGFFTVCLCAKRIGVLHYKTHWCVLRWTHALMCVQLLRTIYSIYWHTNQNSVFIYSKPMCGYTYYASLF